MQELIEKIEKHISDSYIFTRQLDELSESNIKHVTIVTKVIKALKAREMNTEEATALLKTIDIDLDKKVYKCPECEAQIEHLDFTVSGYEYGTYEIKDEEYNYDGTEATGSYCYECPECNSEVDLDLLTN